MLALNAREGMQEPVERVASFDEIEEGLDWYTGSSEARGAVHDLFVNGDDAGQGRPFLRSHSFKVGDLSWQGKHPREADLVGEFLPEGAVCSFKAYALMIALRANPKIRTDRHFY